MGSLHFLYPAHEFFFVKLVLNEGALFPSVLNLSFSLGLVLVSEQLALLKSVVLDNHCVLVL